MASFSIPFGLYVDLILTPHRPSSLCFLLHNALEPPPSFSSGVSLPVINGADSGRQVAGDRGLPLLAPP